MFEKEAEEIANKKLCSERICYNHCNFNSPKHHRCGEWHRIYECAKDGAEFGYNKANEWHYVKDGDLPKEIKEYLVYKIDGYGCKSIQVMQFNNRQCWCVNCQNEIIAWKEIVLPKESE